MDGEVQYDQYPVFKYWFKERPNKTPTPRRLRLALLKEHKNCFWCGVEMNDNIPKDGEEANRALATIDHLDSRPIRGRGGVTFKVLACYKCNMERSVSQNPNRGVKSKS